VSCSIPLTDEAHHHVAVGIMFVVLDAFWEVLVRTALPAIVMHLFDNLMQEMRSSLDLRLACVCVVVGTLSSFFAQQLYADCPFVYLPADQLALVCGYIHHSYVGACLTCGGAVHGSIWFIRTSAVDGTLAHKLLTARAAVVSHLSWLTLLLGFHTTGIFMHNDTVCAFGQPCKQLLLEPVYALLIQSASGKCCYGLACSTTSMDGAGMLFLPITAGDTLAHRWIALCLHVTVLILLKGAFDARSSTLMPDKLIYGFSFACDGPGRGGTCDISSWDAFYLGC